MPAVIMLVEDNPGEVHLIQEFLLKADIGVRMLVAHSSVEATEILAQRGIYAEIAMPDFILLDVGLRMNAREISAYLKSDTLLKSIPVIILSAPQALEDILKSYELQASGYKPQKLAEYKELRKSINDFWLACARSAESFGAVALLDK